MGRRPEERGPVLAEVSVGFRQKQPLPCAALCPWSGPGRLWVHEHGLAVRPALRAETAPWYYWLNRTVLFEFVVGLFMALMAIVGGILRLRTPYGPWLLIAGCLLMILLVATYAYLRRPVWIPFDSVTGYEIYSLDSATRTLGFEYLRGQRRRGLSVVFEDPDDRVYKYLLQVIPDRYVA